MPGPRLTAAQNGGWGINEADPLGICLGARNVAGRQRLLRLLLLHRYSNLAAQIALPGWQQAPSFAALAERLWDD